MLGMIIIFEKMSAVTHSKLYDFLLKLAFCCFLIPSNMLATTFYIATDGTDAAGYGTAQKPWKTLQYANSQVEANKGHTIYMEAGTYYIGKSDERIELKSGVNLKGAGINKTFLVSQLREVKDGDVLRLWDNGGNQVLSDFTLDGVNRQTLKGIEVRDRSNVTVHHVRIKNFKTFGLTFYWKGVPNNHGAPEEYITDILVHDMKFENCGSDWKGWSSGALQIGQIDGGEFFNIEINKDVDIVEDCGYGIKFYSDGYNRNVSIHDCEIWLTNGDPFWTLDIAIELWNLFEDSEIYNVKTNGWFSLVKGDKGNGTLGAHIHHNQLIAPPNVKTSCGIEAGVSDLLIEHNFIQGFYEGIATWGDHRYHNTHIRYNVFKDMNYGEDEKNTFAIKLYKDEFTPYRDSGGHVYPYENIHIYNNIYHNTKDSTRRRSFVHLAAKSGEIKDIYISNNIIFHESKVPGENPVIDYWTVDSGTISNVNLENNIYYNGILDTGLPSFSSNNVSINSSSNFNADPKLAFTGSNWFEFYTPLIGSPAIDAGKDVGLPFKGAAPNIGIVE